MTDLRFALVEQIHFIAGDPDRAGRDLVVTLQHWKAKTSRTEVYVRCHNGTEIDRRFASTDAERNLIAQSFSIARRDFAEKIVSDDFGGDEISRRGGPKPKWCLAADCGAMVPYAAAQCADGHPVDYVNAGTYAFGGNRRPPLTVITGGRK